MNRGPPAGESRDRSGERGRIERRGGQTGKGHGHDGAPDGPIRCPQRGKAGRRERPSPVAQTRPYLLCLVSGIDPSLAGEENLALRASQSGDSRDGALYVDTRAVRQDDYERNALRNDPVRRERAEGESTLTELNAGGSETFGATARVRLAGREFFPSR